MAQIPDLKPLSEAIARPVVEVYKAGGYALVTAFFGIVLLLAGSVLSTSTPLKFAIAALGASMILLFLYFFYVHDVKKLRGLNRTISANKELIDTVQLIAIEMTVLAYDLQSLAFKHADDVATLITQLRETLHGVESLPLVSNLPGVRALTATADHPVMVRAADLSGAIVNSTSNVKQVIEDVKTALIQSDARLLKKYLLDVRALEVSARQLLSHSGSTATTTATLPRG